MKYIAGLYENYDVYEESDSMFSMTTVIHRLVFVGRGRVNTSITVRIDDAMCVYIMSFLRSKALFLTKPREQVCGLSDSLAQCSWSGATVHCRDRQHRRTVLLITL